MLNTPTISSNLGMAGFIKIWQTNPVSGETSLLVDKKNTILYQGCDLLAKSLSGINNAKISHMYLSYINSSDNPPSPSKVIDKQYSVPFSGYASPYGVLRLPLTFPASYQASSTSYSNNIPLFTVMLTSATAEWGEAFTSSAPTPSWIFETGLVAALDPASSNNDIVFSRVQFNPIQYVSNYNLTITWGVQFTAEPLGG